MGFGVVMLRIWNFRCGGNSQMSLLRSCAVGKCRGYKDVGSYGAYSIVYKNLRNLCNLRISPSVCYFLCGKIPCIASFNVPLTMSGPFGSENIELI